MYNVMEEKSTAGYQAQRPLAQEVTELQNVLEYSGEVSRPMLLLCRHLLLAMVRNWSWGEGLLI